MDLVKEIYTLVSTFPKEEMYGLTSQMKRAVISIPSNIAEGKRRRTQSDFAHFLTIAFGSCAELETQVDISIMLEFTTPTHSKRAVSLIEEIMKMLSVMITNLHKPTA